MLILFVDLIWLLYFDFVYFIILVWVCFSVVFDVGFVLYLRFCMWLSWYCALEVARVLIAFGLNVVAGLLT